VLPELVTFEHFFATALRDPDAEDGLAGRPEFAVYRNTVASGAIEALRSSFPTIALLIGGEAFGRLAFDYQHAEPPASPVLAFYGDTFPDFVAGQSWLEELPYLADVARIDRMRSEAHVAADADAFAFTDLDRISSYDWMTLRIRLHPACRYRWFRTPATSIWLAHAEGEPDGMIEPEWQAEGALVTRPNGVVSTIRIGRAERRLLLGMWLGDTIGEAASAVATVYPEADISAAFALLISSGALLAPEERD